ncbi:DUF4435 domain-containing protein [Pseudomonas fluorescens]|uniref:DUF4435 domain-containing protein n=1 Tax=Pseudomonas fluorescens TaxID=294 RepID=UPI0007D0946E|nr:DUF4435 domain-containing protein [Pseudomonas fluorescens]
MNDWDKNVGIIVSEIIMMETSSKGLYWLLEGPSDIRFFEARKRPEVELIVSGGKRNVIGSIQALNENPVSERMLGIVDADIDWLLEVGSMPSNVITTDPRDLEGVLLRSSAYIKVLAEFSDPVKVKAFEERKKCTVLEYVRDVAMHFGKIRAVNDLNGGVSLRKFGPQAFMQKGAWVYDVESAIRTAVEKGVCVSVDDLNAKVQGLPEVDPWSYVRGHDAVNILAGGMVSEIGRGGKVDSDRIESVLRSGIEEVEFRETKLHRSIAAWHLSRGASVT